MTLCEQCGSISIVRAQPEPMDKLVRLFTAKRPFVCRRCGWKGRRSWTDADLRKLMDYGAGGAEPDPALAILDTRQEASVTRSGRKDRRRKPMRKPDTTPAQFDLATLDLANAGTPHATAIADASTSRALPGERRSVRKRRKKSRRREIVATIAATALVMFLVVLLGLTGSCSGGADAL